MRRDRKDFKKWCIRVAEDFNYTVHFEDFGHATEEMTAISNGCLNDAGQDVGGATQVRP